MTTATRTLPWEAVKVYQSGGQTGPPIQASFRQSRQTHGLDWEPRKTEVFINLLGPDGPMPAQLDDWRAVIRSELSIAYGPA